MPTGSLRSSTPLSRWWSGKFCKDFLFFFFSSPNKLYSSSDMQQGHRIAYEPSWHVTTNILTWQNCPYQYFGKLIRTAMESLCCQECNLCQTEMASLGYSFLPTKIETKAIPLACSLNWCLNIHLSYVSCLQTSLTIKPFNTDGLVKNMGPILHLAHFAFISLCMYALIVWWKGIVHIPANVAWGVWGTHRNHYLILKRLDIAW